MRFEWFDNSYWEDYTEYDATKNGDALGCIFVDGFPEDVNESGEVIAKVYITKHNDIIIDWRYHEYKMNNIVMELIEESKKRLMDGYSNYVEE